MTPWTWRPLGGDVAIPDTVVSRPDDDSTTREDEETEKAGLKFTLKTDWPSIGAIISNNTTDVTRAYLHETDSDGNLGDEIESVDVSDKSSGDSFVFEDVDLKDGDDHFIVLDAEGDTFTVGFASDSGFPYESNDLDITERLLDGADPDKDPCMVNDIGNTGFD